MCYFATAQNAVLLISKLLMKEGWPFYRMTAAAFFLSASSFFFVLLVKRQPLPETSDRIWVVLRGMCGAFNFIFQVLAVKSGIPLGDLSTFTSVNMVIAAFLGRIFLGEALRFVHFIALCSSLAGATLIAKPSFIFGSSGSTGASGVGYLFALSAGFIQAALFICARKSQGSSVLHHSLSSQSMACVAVLIASFTPMVDDASLVAALDSPGEIAFWIALLFTCMLTGTLSMSNAAKLCPAAVSAMMCTATMMIIGYVAQILFLGVTPETSTIGGACLMFLGVVSMVVARAASSGPAAEVPQDQQVVEDASSPDTAADDDEAESLASFVSSEFAVWAPHEKTVRQRHTSSNLEPPAQRLGVVPALMQAAI